MHRGLLVTVLAALSVPSFGTSAGTDPFAALKPEIALDTADRQLLDTGKIVMKILPSEDHQLAVVAAASLKATAAELSAQMNDTARLEKGPKVPEIARFSNPPTLDDLNDLTLDDVDLRAIRSCRPGDCALKLSDRELEELHRAGAHTTGASFANAMNAEFRHLILDRVNAYLKQGLSGIPPYSADRDPMDLEAAFAALLQQNKFLQLKAPQLRMYLAHYPAAARPHGTTASFLYWSKEEYAWKPIVSVTEVTILTPRESTESLELVIASKEVFATRYTSGGLDLTFLVHGTDPVAPHYMVYVSRTWIDGLHAFLRPFINYHVKSEGAKVLADVRARIEQRAASQGASE